MAAGAGAAAAAAAAADPAAVQQAASSSTTAKSSRTAGGAARKAVQPPRGRRSTSDSAGSGNGHGGSSSSRDMVQGPHVTVPQPLPHVLILHTGGTLGMDAKESFDVDPEDPHHLQIKKGTGGIYSGLEPGDMLANLFQQVPELCQFANLDLQVVFNKDSSRMGPREWVQIAKILDKNRQAYDAFLVVHGTDTLAYTAAALSLMLQGFRKPILLTEPDRCADLCHSAYTPPHMALSEVAVCFGGKLMRGNRAQKVNSSNYQAFDSPTYPHLAALGVDVEWNERYLLRVEGGYRPRFNLEPAVIRIPIVPGSDPRVAYGDLAERGVKGVVLEAFGVGNMPDLPQQGWMPWLRQQTKKGLQVYLASQCHLGPLNPELYRSGAMAVQMGVEAGPQMTPECAVVKMMLCLAYPDIPLGLPLAGEL
ncbi:Asparaginase/glutaminase [Scenedesmus sp. NREL 46B-D3]|nr:Asparaginase/glutaminase [Scenedesmus sp. NREL 46B-D3]